MTALLLSLLPLVALLAALVLGRYPGEQALARARSARRAPRRQAAVRRPVAHAPRLLLPRGGALLATALAGRAPPGG